MSKSLRRAAAERKKSPFRTVPAGNWARMERGSDQHGPREDDALRARLRGQFGSATEMRNGSYVGRIAGEDVGDIGESGAEARARWLREGGSALGG